ncbi:hypothetical protein BJ508DRAFT_374619 [Ascobolus immersus RN42]|uniref:SGNH hydrolase n=1 Tax=Ascobolus immersus RN42 TaxID=1160509 RepID=A0A3N4ID18_ASCIM|nr:hypothetical protein BJ508DRAFT_374619 [Ascobolus immersus RN42]
MDCFDTAEEMAKSKTSRPRTRRSKRLKKLVYNALIVFALWIIYSSIAHWYPFSAPITPARSYPPPPYNLRTGPDHLLHFKHRSDCPVSSHSILTTVQPYCTNTTALLESISGGGRIGFDAPYVPRGCGMKWYNTKEVCEVLGRWGKIAVTGDSMMRHMVGALNVLVREDLGYGAVTDWNFSEEEKEQCFCLTQFNVKSCSVQGIFKTADVEKNDPSSLACGLGKINVFIEQIVQHPIPKDELSRLITALTINSSAKPTALLYGMGLWNDLSLPSAKSWLEEIESALITASPPNSNSLTDVPRLFITPNAAGKEKLDDFIVKQGDKQLQIYEEGIRRLGEEKGFQTLGTWNSTVQIRKWDGVHVDLRGNLLKAMMVVNWLDLVWKERFGG